MSDQTGQDQLKDGQEKAAQYQTVQDQKQPLANKDQPAEQDEQGQVSTEEASGQQQTDSITKLEKLQRDSLQQQLNSANEEVAKQKEALLRMAAELENTRRRHVDEINKAHKYAIEGFAEALLPVKDSLEAAIGLQEQGLDTLKEGVSATLRQLEQAFDKGKVQVINPQGEKFDPNLHQAVSAVPGQSQEPPVEANFVIDVMQKGYTINERVLRPALVLVSQ